jgi:hypothetical protein
LADVSTDLNYLHYSLPSHFFIEALKNFFGLFPEEVRERFRSSTRLVGDFVAPFVADRMPVGIGQKLML